MSDTQDRLDTLETKVIALTMLVDMLLVNLLDAEKDPREIARIMVEDVYEKDRKLMNGPNDKRAMKISEALIASFDRASTIVLLRREREHRP